MFSLSPTPISLISCPPKAKWWSLATGKLSPVSRASSVEVEGGGRGKKWKRRKEGGREKKEESEKINREEKVSWLLYFSLSLFLHFYHFLSSSPVSKFIDSRSLRSALFLWFEMRESQFFCALLSSML